MKRYVATVTFVLALLLLYRLLQWRQRVARRLALRLTSGLSPVVLVPGLGGSRLYSRPRGLAAQWRQCWLGWEAFLPYNTPSSVEWRSSLSVRYQSGLYLDGGGVKVSACRQGSFRNGKFVLTQDFGGVTGVGNVLHGNVNRTWQFEAIIQALVGLGYSTFEESGAGCNLMAAPYDFRNILERMRWEAYCYRLMHLIETSAHRLANKVTLVSHSLGSALLLTFFVKYLVQRFGEDGAANWKNAHIKKWVTVNGAFAGAGKALRSALSGDSNGLGVLCKDGCHEWYLPLIKNAAGVLWMLPDPAVFSSDSCHSAPILTIDRAEGLCESTEGVGLSERNERIERNECIERNEHIEYYNAKTQENALELSAREAYRDTVLPMRTLRAPGVPVTAIVVHKKPTMLTLKYENRVHHSSSSMGSEHDFYEKVYRQGGATAVQARLFPGTVSAMCGDGTVPYLSLMVPKLWGVGNGGHPVLFLRCGPHFKLGHSSILREARGIKLIVGAITA